MPSVSVVIPAYNEEASIGDVVRAVRSTLSGAGMDSQILVVVDGATDRTEQEAAEVADSLIVHPQTAGYGRSLKTGILAAKHDLIAITDADGTYPVDRLADMIPLAEKFHMVVGARTGTFYQGGAVKRIGRLVFQHLSQFAAGQHIPDINSGLRVFRRSDILNFFPVISAGFSFTTTVTLAYLLNDLFVHYLPIEYHERSGKSKVRHFRDSLRALQIIVEAILRFNPVKIFLLLALPLLALALLLGLAALALGGEALGLGSLVALCTAFLLVGLGFLAVAVLPRNQTTLPPARALPVAVAEDRDQ